MKTKITQKLLVLVFLLFGLTTMAQVKVGDNPTTIHASAVLENESTTKGFLPPRMTNAQKNAITSPATGLIVYCTDCNTCSSDVGELQIYNGATNGGWKCVSAGSGNNGLGVFTVPDCNAITVNGNLYKNTNLQGVTATVPVNVTKLGSYSFITNVADGFYFVGSGSFTTLGTQNVTLTAFGIPANTGTFAYSFNSNGNSCTFNATVLADPATRVVKVLSIVQTNGNSTGQAAYGDGTSSSTWARNLWANNPTEFGPNGTVKVGSFQFDVINMNTFAAKTTTDITTYLGGYDFIEFPYEATSNYNLLSPAQETAIKDYAATKKSIIVTSGDDYGDATLNDAYDLNATMGVNRVLQANAPSTGLGPGGPVIFESGSGVAPIDGVFGSMHGKQLNVVGNTWIVNIGSRTNLIKATAFHGNTSSTGSITTYWDPTYNYLHVGDDDWFGSQYGTTAVKSNTLGGVGNAALLYANLMAYIIQTTPAK